MSKYPIGEKVQNFIIDSKLFHVNSNEPVVWTVNSQSQLDAFVQDLQHTETNKLKARIAELEAEVAYEQERNQNNVTMADSIFSQYGQASTLLSRCRKVVGGAWAGLNSIELITLAGDCIQDDIDDARKVIRNQLNDMATLIGDLDNLLAGKPVADILNRYDKEG